MIKILFTCLILIIATPNFAKADPSPLTSADLMIVKKWLAGREGTDWHLLYSEMDGKKYQWIITKEIREKDFSIGFTADKEIDDNGKVIGNIIPATDQFFTLVIDKETYAVTHVLLGG
ncbi:MAG: hypothetical protein KUG81_08415 [Gammaproteobacteria bacterium]|nr:hypothetical protein [Gammaproteobacteria bacterium]